MKKIIISMFLLICLICSLCSCIVIEDDASNNGGNSTSGADANSSDSGDFGDFNIVIDSCRLGLDYKGNEIIIVKYIFTNKDDSTTSFSGNVEDKVYQDGIGLNECYFVDSSSNYSSDNKSREIKPGVSLEVEVAYELNNTQSDIEVEVSEYFSWSDKILNKTFSISSLVVEQEVETPSETEATETESEEVNETAKPSSNKSNLGKYDVAIDSCRLAIDYSGKDIVIVKYVFTNNSGDSASFSWSVDDNVYQNGIGLKECYFVDSTANYSSDNKTKEIKPGVPFEVEVAYTLNDLTTEIEVVVTDLLNLSGKSVEKTFSIK